VIHARRLAQPAAARRREIPARSARKTSSAIAARRIDPVAGALHRREQVAVKVERQL
jgi:hypothetical protein